MVVLLQAPTNVILPTHPASYFKIGQEFIWVQETESQILTFGGQVKKSKSQYFSRQRVVEIKDTPKSDPSATTRLTGNPGAIETIRRKNNRADGTLRIAGWFGNSIEAISKVEPGYVQWLKADERSEYQAARDAISFASKEYSLPGFSFTPIGLLVTQKHQVKEVDVWSGNHFQFRLTSTDIVTIDGYECLEVVGPVNVAYFRLSDGLIQRVKEQKSEETEFKIDDVLGKGTITRRAYRLDKLPAK